MALARRFAFLTMEGCNMSKPPASGPEGDAGPDSNKKTGSEPHGDAGKKKAMEEAQEDAAEERATEGGYQ